MATPEQKCPPKNYITKCISKSLLTPCRRIGLSRTKKTPKAQTPVLLSPDISTIARKDDLHDITPKRCLKTPAEVVDSRKTNEKDIKEYLKVSIETSSGKQSRKALSSNIKDEESITQHCENDQNTEQNTESPAIPKATLHHSMAKRSINFNEMTKPLKELPEMFAADDNRLSTRVEDVKPPSRVQNDVLSKEENEKCLKVNYQDPDSPSCSPIISRVEVQVHHSTVKHNVDEKSPTLTPNFQTKNRTDEENVEEDFASGSKKRRKLQLDSAEFDDGWEENKYTKKIDQKNGYVSLIKFTTEEYLNEFSQNPKLFQESLDMHCDSTLNDLGDFQPEKQKSNKKIETYKAVVCAASKSEKNQSSKTLTVSLEKLNTRSLKQSSKTHSKPETKEKIVSQKFTFDADEDDMFTSSPETDKRQRENLLKLIEDLESQILKKGEIIERLKQAQVYKKMHSPVKLNASSDRWIEGCRTAIKDLLSKMQEHCPMEIDFLLKKLHIPEHVIEKLKLV